jgi:hypothetical protein
VATAVAELAGSLVAAMAELVGSVAAAVVELRLAG